MKAFREASDALRLTAEELASIYHRPAQSVRQMRLDPTNPNYRPPPDNWRDVMARLARERSGELLNLADELERAHGERKGVHE